MCTQPMTHFYQAQMSGMLPSQQQMLWGAPGMNAFSQPTTLMPSGVTFTTEQVHQSSQGASQAKRMRTKFQLKP